MTNPNLSEREQFFEPLFLGKALQPPEAAIQGMNDEKLRTSLSVGKVSENTAPKKMRRVSRRLKGLNAVSKSLSPVVDLGKFCCQKGSAQLFPDGVNFQMIIQDASEVLRHLVYIVVQSVLN